MCVYAWVSEGWWCGADVCAHIFRVEARRVNTCGSMTQGPRAEDNDNDDGDDDHHHDDDFAFIWVCVDVYLQCIICIYIVSVTLFTLIHAHHALHASTVHNPREHIWNCQLLNDTYYVFTVCLSCLNAVAPCVQYTLHMTRL